MRHSYFYIKRIANQNNLPETWATLCQKTCIIKRLRQTCLLILCALAVSCGSKRQSVSHKRHITKSTKTVVSRKLPKSGDMVAALPILLPKTVEEYIAMYASIAKKQMKTHQIPASIILAQGILESGSGRGSLAVNAYNHFGIKCHGWEGQKIYHDDDEAQECFRKYEHPESSFKDHSEFLVSRKRYADLFTLKSDDYKRWAKGLKAAGYATDRHYPQKLITLIERHKLYRFDDEVLGKRKSAKASPKSNVITHVVQKGDTLFALSKRYQTTVEAIKEWNNLTSNALSIGAELIISK